MCVCCVRAGARARARVWKTRDYRRDLRQRNEEVAENKETHKLLIKMEGLSEERSKKGSGQ